MKIGIGITSYKRPEHLRLCLSQLHEYLSFHETVIYVAEDKDTDRKGVAYRKNECLSYLKDCDYIFLFDDDCFPIKKGWEQYFIDMSNITREKHFLYLKETPSIKRIGAQGMYQDGVMYNLVKYDNCGGCFMFLTNQVIREVGGFCKDYGIYGFEHAGYTQRIFKAGLITYPYLCPEFASRYIYSLDYDNHMMFNRKLNHYTSIDVLKIPEYLNKNSAVYQKDISTIFQEL